MLKFHRELVNTEQIDRKGKGRTEERGKLLRGKKSLILANYKIIHMIKAIVVFYTVPAHDKAK